MLRCFISQFSNNLLAVDCFSQPDLKIFVQHLASQRDSGGEHAGVHQAHRLAVHQEPVKTWKRKIVWETSPLHPSTDICTAPSSWISWYLRFLYCQAGLGFLNYKIQRFIWIHFPVLWITEHWRPGKPGDFQIVRTGGEATVWQGDNLCWWRVHIVVC